MESIKFHFHGGMAENHELNFYEAGRFQYGAARWIYTLERYRQDGRIVSRLASRVDVDIRVRAPERGSFLQEVLIVAAPIVANCAIQVPVEAMVAYAWNKIFPPKPTDTELAVRIAQAEVAKEQERTRQIELLTDVANNNSATTQQALAILGETVRQGQAIQLGDQQIALQAIQLAHDRCKAAVERQEIIQEFREPLARIDPDEADRLAGQLRRSVPDMVLPLRSSAASLNIGGGETRKSFAALDYQTGQEIGSQFEDRDRQAWRGSIKSYDREQGTGKFRYDEFRNPISFRIPDEQRGEVSRKVLQAMRMNTVLASVQFVRDKFHNVVSIILWDLFPEEGEE